MEGVSSRLSSAALETLAIVAYKQPVSRAQVAALRGVNVDGVVRLLANEATSPSWVTPRGRACPFFTAPRRHSSRSWAWRDWTSCLRWRISFPGPRTWRSSRSSLRPGADA